MSVVEFVGLSIAMGLMAYLIVAFLRPEWFA